MSVVFACRDVAAVAPPLGLEAEAEATAAVHDKKASSASSFLPSGDGQMAKGETRIATVGGSTMGLGLSLGVGSGKSIPSSESSSSIGLPDGDSDSDGGEEEVASNPNGSLASLSSLEESLPIKRGLSNNFTGKSRSFANLSEVSTVRDIEKPENPLNKRRRTMIAYKLSKKSSSSGGGGSGFGNNTFMPVLALNEEEEEEEEESEVSGLEEEGERNRNGQQFLRGSKPCFSLTAARR